jgi:hypothetical protein
VAERLKALVLKTSVPARVPWVRIPPPPLYFFAAQKIVLEYWRRDPGVFILISISQFFRLAHFRSAYGYRPDSRDSDPVGGFPSLVGFQGSRTEGYLFGGGLDLAPQVTVTSDPWSVVAVGSDDIGIFRNTSGLWADKGTSRVYFGKPGDIPVTR